MSLVGKQTGTRAGNYSRFSMILGARFQITTIRRLVTNTNSLFFLNGIFFIVVKEKGIKVSGNTPHGFSLKLVTNKRAVGSK